MVDVNIKVKSVQARSRLRLRLRLRSKSRSRSRFVHNLIIFSEVAHVYADIDYGVLNRVCTIVCAQSYVVKLYPSIK